MGINSNLSISNHKYSNFIRMNISKELNNNLKILYINFLNKDIFSMNIKN